MRRSLALLVIAGGCFSDPPVVGGTTASSTSNGSGSEGSSASSGMTSSDDSAMTSGVMTSSAEATSSLESTTVEPQTSGTTGSSGGSGGPGSGPSESGNVGTCTCQFDSGSARVPGGAYECVEGGAEPMGADFCPEGFDAGSPCMAFGVTLYGCCSNDGKVLFCMDNEAGTEPTQIDCTLPCE